MSTAVISVLRTLLIVTFVAVGIGTLPLAPVRAEQRLPFASQDPCAPDASGAVPPMCQSGNPTPIAPSGPFFDASFTQLVTGDAVSRRVFDVAGGTISYASGVLSASVGCNQLTADAILRLGSALVVTSPLRSTKMYCDGLMEAEAALITILEGGDLQLTPDGITGAAGLVRIDGGVTIAMPGGVNSGGGLVSDDSGAPILTIESGGESYAIQNGHFSLDGGRLAASVGCNSIGGEAQLRGDKIEISGELMQTEMYCEGLMDAEAALVAVLSGANLRFSAAYTISSDAGSFTIAPTLCGPGCPPTPSEGSLDTLFGVLLLLLPIAVLVWFALRRRGKSRGSRRR